MYALIGNIIGYQPLDLSQELGVSQADALQIIQSVGSPAAGPIEISAKDLLLKAEGDRIITLCKAMDDLLGGGIAVGQIVSPILFI